MKELTPLQKARAWCAKEFRKRRVPGEHASHVTEVILREASKKFNLDDYGVAGFCDDLGKKGCHYLNYGDPYTTTLCALTDGPDASFTVAWGGWATYANGEYAPKDREPALRREEARQRRKLLQALKDA